MELPNNKILMFYISGLVLKGFILVNIYLSAWMLSSSITIFAMFISFYIDQYIMEKNLDDDFRKNHLFIFSIPFFAAFLSQSGFFYTYYSPAESFSLYYMLVGFGFFVLFVYQRNLVKLFINKNKLSRFLLHFSTYFAAIISTGIVFASFYSLPPYFENFIPRPVELLALLYLVSLAQAFAMLLYIYQRFYAAHKKKMEIDKDFNIWNTAGFINNTSNIRHICARLDQNVTLALLKIDRYQTFQTNMPAEEFKGLIKTFVQGFRYSLRKHDQFAVLDNNIFAVLLPFTDLNKGGMACSRLGQTAKAEILSKKLALPEDFTVSFGLTLVHKNEGNVVPAMKRAAAALSRAKPGSVEKYSEADKPTSDIKSSA